jgi:hypothetical protein
MVLESRHSKVLAECANSEESSIRRPRNNIPPGGSASFTEDWYLLPHPFPAAGAELI